METAFNTNLTEMILKLVPEKHLTNGHISNPCIVAYLQSKKKIIKISNNRKKIIGHNYNKIGFMVCNTRLSKKHIFYGIFNLGYFPEPWKTSLIKVISRTG